jgi:hypothetical protein
MTTLTLPERALYAVPVLGWMLKDVVHGDRANIWWFIVALVSLWIMAILTFGYAAFILPVLAAVPVAFVLLILITRG